MKRIFNWRCIVIALLLAATLFLIGGESDSDKMFYASKPLGFACGYLMYRLARRWEGEGKIKITNNEQI